MMCGPGGDERSPSSSRRARTISVESPSPRGGRRASRAHAPPGGRRASDCVRRRRPRLRARCEGGADGEEEGVGRGPPPLPNPGRSPAPSPWRRRKEERTRPHTFLGPRNKSFGGPGKASVWTRGPGDRRTRVSPELARHPTFLYAHGF